VLAYTGLSYFKIGTYSYEKESIGYYSLPIEYAMLTYGGILIEGGTLTDYCQQMYSPNAIGDFTQILSSTAGPFSNHDICSACVEDASCQYAPNNGGCISIHAYVPDFGCPRQVTTIYIYIYIYIYICFI